MATAPKQHKKEGGKPEQFLTPRVIHLGANLPLSAIHYVTELWVPDTAGTFDGKDKLKTNDSRTSPRYKNLYEYYQRHKNQFNLKPKSWKIPSYSNNVLPTNKRSSISRDSGTSERMFQEWYSRVVNQDNVVLPPLHSRKSSKDPLKLPSSPQMLSPRRPSKERKTMYQSELNLPELHLTKVGMHSHEKRALSERYPLRGDRTAQQTIYKTDMARALAQSSMV